jgi:hypothetical protein
MRAYTRRYTLGKYQASHTCGSIVPASIRVGLHSGNRSFVGPDADTCPGTNPQCDTKHCAKYLARIICKDVIVSNTVYSSPHQKLELAYMQDVSKQRQKLHELSITVLSRAHRILTHLKPDIKFFNAFTALAIDPPYPFQLLTAYVVYPFLPCINLLHPGQLPQFNPSEQY